MLDALPEDIRCSIEEALREKRRCAELDGTSPRENELVRGPPSAAQCFVDDAEEAACSHWTASDASTTLSASSKHPVLFPSYSQVAGHLTHCRAF